MNPKTRIMAVIKHKKPDHMPCFAANSTVTYDQMEKVQTFWPQGHENGEAMAKQALAAYTVLGFDAVRVPFDQAFEAEALGCKMKPGGQEGIPGVDGPPPYKLEDIPILPDDFLSRCRIPELLRAVRILKSELGDEVPILAGIVGPLTLTASLLGITTFLKATIKMPDKIKPFLFIAEKAGTLLAKALIDAGADIIVNEDMMASPNLIRPQTYREYAQPYESKQFQAISVPKILHICGNVESIGQWMGETGAEILSIDPKTSPKVVREKCGPNPILMGGVDTATTLPMGTTEAIRQQCKKSIRDGIQILAPGCAIAPSTPTANLLVMVEVARKAN